MRGMLLPVVSVVLTGLAILLDVAWGLMSISLVLVWMSGFFAGAWHRD